MARKQIYVLVNLIDEVMGIVHSDMQDEGCHSLLQKRFFSDLGFKFSIGMFRYRSGGGKADWVVIFWVSRGT